MVTKKVSKKSSTKKKVSVSSQKKVSLSEPSNKKTKSNGKNLASIILGAVSIVFAFFLPYAVAITGVLGIIFAYTEKGKVSKKSSLWALVLNLVAIFLAIIILSLSFIALLVLSNGKLGTTGVA